MMYRPKIWQNFDNSFVNISTVAVTVLLFTSKTGKQVFCHQCQRIETTRGLLIGSECSQGRPLLRR
jgi:hypothetical protein